MAGLKLFHADQFLRLAIDHRVVYYGGEVGSGKSSLMAAMSYFLLRGRYVQNCVATMPLAWAIPAEDCPPANFVLCLDELGVKLDARSFADKKQNEDRLSTLAYLRKLNIYVILASRIAPDISFRALTVQRAFSIEPLLPLEFYAYGFEDGSQKAVGWFGVYNRRWLWKVGRGRPSPVYGNEYVPVGFNPALDLVKRAIKVAAVGSEEPNEAPEGWRDRLCRWFGVEPEHSPDHLPRSAHGGDADYLSRTGGAAEETGSVGVVGVVSEKARSGNVDFTM